MSSLFLEGILTRSAFRTRYSELMPNVGPGEIVLLLVLALLLFGAKRVPEIGRSVGRGMREFKDSLAGIEPTAPQTPASLDVATEVDSVSGSSPHREQICSKCGTKTSSEARFCSSCGAALERSEATVVT
jgi:TatA/E family protein of Tat protein translocase